MKPIRTRFLDVTSSKLSVNGAARDFLPKALRGYALLFFIALLGCGAESEFDLDLELTPGQTESTHELTTCEDEYWWCYYYESWCSDSIYSDWLQENCQATCDTCPQAEVEKETVNVMSWNMACRDSYPFDGCDNCSTRFEHIAKAIDGGSGYTGLPDFDSLDIIVGQELFTQPQRYQAITEALVRKGFTHVMSPAPNQNSSQCGTPLQPNEGVKMGDNGGLVMWSRYPVKSFKTRLWCAHGFPTYQGYSAALVEVEGRNIVVFNMHMMPEYNVAGIQAEDLRMYQFSEIANLSKEIDNQLSAAGASFSIIIGGDYNEDAYSLNHKSATPACEKITNRDVKTKFNALNFDLVRNCQDGIIGAPTWDPTNNDLAGRFSTSGKHEILDFLIEYGSSDTAKDAKNNVYNISYAPGWSGQFCDNPSQGVLGGTHQGNAKSLSDHNAVVASFDLPYAASTIPDAANVFDAAFDQFAVQKAACGQASTQCVVDANCCRSKEYSFDGNAYQCSHGACVPAKLEGESCTWLREGSECMDYNVYNAGVGLHCESGTCVRKYQAGASCLYDHECDSNSCSWGWTGRSCD